MKREEKRDPNYRLVGRVLRPHGVRGEVRVELFSDELDLVERETFLLGRRVSQLETYGVEGVRVHQGRLLLKFVGVDDRDEADALRGLEVYIPRAELPPLAENEFYLYELVGMGVVLETGERFGVVKDVLRTGGANDVFVVSTAVDGDGNNGQEVLIPDIAEVVLAVKRAEKEIVIRLMEGLI